jgi:Type I restriction modification DNA specificity domain
VEQLPELPEGWCWATLEQCSRRITDGTHQPPPFVEKGIPFIFVKHIVKGQITFEGTKYISEATYQELNSRCPVEIGDILYSAVGSYGVAVPVLASQPFSFQRHIAHIKPSRLLSLSYLVTCLNSTIGLEQAHRVARGVAQKTVTLTDLARFVIPLPPLTEQEQIVSEVEAKLSNIAQMEETIEASLKRAEHERQSILREAFAGRLTSQDPEDEPASVLLERIRAERKKREEAEKVARASRKEIQVEVAKKRRAGKAGLYTTLVEVGRRLPPDDLFRRAGLKVDEQPESVEAFYEELHASENMLIKETRPDDAHVLLEALEPPAEVLARMAEEEAARQAQEAEQSQKTLDAPMLWNMEPPREL